MLTLADSFTWVDKLAVVAALILGAGVLIGAFSALRFTWSRRPQKSSARIDFEDPLVYPQEGLFSLLSFLTFNVLVVYLAFYVSWPLWLRLFIAPPFLFMAAFCCFFASVIIADWLRARRDSRSSHRKQ